MGKARRQYSAVEKAKVALAAIKGEMTIAEIVCKYAVHATQVKKWKKQALEQLPEAFSGKQKQVQSEHTAMLSELYEQIGRLKVENEFLKKKCDLFAG
jgi:transposase